MWGLVIFIPIIALAIFVSRKNMNNRVIELTKNADEYKEDLKSLFLSLTEDQQDKFFTSLNDKEGAYLQLLINNDKISYSSNVWGIQQHLIDQQEIMNKLNNFMSNIHK